MTRDARTEPVDMERLADGKRERLEDLLAVEEPLVIQLRRGDVTETLLTTMRTPGHDRELAAGLLFAERILRTPDDIADISHSANPRIPNELRVNTLIVTVREEHPFSVELNRRTFITNAACGVCGRLMVEDLRKSGFPYSLRPHRTVSADVLYGLPEALRQAQQVFDRTGGLHATGLFDLSGRLLSLHEDIGRHNATDKMIGTEWLAGRTPLDERVVLLSGRASFEIVQKGLMAGVGILAAIGAPSSLAVDLALEYGMTLVGFLRNGRLNIYSVPERIV